MSVTDEMVTAAASYTTTTPHNYHPGTPAPRRRVAVVACMDARLDLFRMLGLRVGDAHILRNAGGSVTDDTVRSLVISQRKLGTREIVLVHHTGCGMTSFDDDTFRAELQQETGATPPWRLGAFRDPASDVRASMETIRQCPWLPSHHVRGFVYDVANRRLHEVRHADRPAPASAMSPDSARPAPGLGVNEAPWLWSS